MKEDWVALARINAHRVYDKERTTARIALGRAVAHNYQWAVYLRRAVAYALESGLTAEDIHEIIHGERAHELGPPHRSASEISDEGLSTEAIWEYPLVVAGGNRMVRRLQQEASEDFDHDVSTLRRAHTVANQAGRGEDE